MVAIRMVSSSRVPRTVTVSPRCATTDSCGSRPYITLFVSSYSASFAPGTFLVHSGDSAKASSALQLLDTRIPDHDPDFVAEFIELFCPATARGAMEKSTARQRKKRFAVESVPTESINSNPRFIFESPGTVHRTVSSHNACQ